MFTNRCGAGRLLPTESLPFGSCARLDYVLVPQDSIVSQWHVPNDLDHCSDTHSPVLATIQYSHPKGSGARRCAARDNAAHDPDRAFQYLGSLSGADLRAQMGECSERWMQLVRELDGITEQPSQEEVDRLWTEGVLRPAVELGERARNASASRPSTALSSRRTGDKVLDRAIYVRNRLRTAIRRLYTWRAYLHLPRSGFNRTSAGLGWLPVLNETDEAAALMKWVLHPVDPVANRRFGAAFATSTAAQPINDASQACRAAAAVDGVCDPFDTVWSDWLKAVYDLFRRHRKELSARRSAWDAIIRATAATLREEQQKTRRFGALFRQAAVHGGLR